MGWGKRENILININYYIYFFLLFLLVEEDILKKKHSIEDIKKRTKEIRLKYEKLKEEVKEVKNDYDRKNIYLKINESLLKKFNNKYKLVKEEINEAQMEYDKEVFNSLKKSLIIPPINLNLSNCWEELEHLRKENRELDNFKNSIDYSKKYIRILEKKRNDPNDEFEG